jgi:hypothetical protein
MSHRGAVGSIAGALALLQNSQELIAAENMALLKKINDGLKSGAWICNVGPGVRERKLYGSPGVLVEDGWLGK